MTSSIDICNRALQEIGTRSTIANFAEGSVEAINCGIVYDPIRRMLMRAAPWGFNRKQISMSLLGTAALQTALPPWAFEYLYPADCLKLRYMIATSITVPTATVVPTTGIESLWGYGMGSRRFKFIVSSDVDINNNPRRVVLTNLQDAIAIYAFDCQVPDMFDSMFVEAFVVALGAKLAIPLTGDKALAKMKADSANIMIQNARAADGNEAMPSVDHQPDWITTRGTPGGYGGYPFYNSDGYYWENWDEPSWGM